MNDDITLGMPVENSDSGYTQDENLYQTLNVTPNATRLEIRESFLRLKSTYNAGSAALYSLISEEESNAALHKIEEAFRTLNDSVARRAYDDQMGFTSSESSPMTEAMYGLEGMSDPIHDSQVERINHMRQHADTSLTAPMRPAMPIVKVKAAAAGKAEMAAKFAALIAEADPSDGDLLRQLREAAGVSVDELQDRTKVSVCYINDMEVNRFDRLPQLVYVKGFLRCIYKYLGVEDSDRLVKAYAERLQEWLSTR